VAAVDERAGGRCCRERRGDGARRGLLEPAVLAALAGAPAHGYDLRSAVDDLTAGVVAVDPGGLYRALRRMEDDGLVASTWEEGTHGPQRRTYRITDDGREQLRHWLSHLTARREAIARVLLAACTANEDLCSTTHPGAEHPGATQGEEAGASRLATTPGEEP
jgi:DNA-binding PadR family transcriptional regulator